MLKFKIQQEQCYPDFFGITKHFYTLYLAFSILLIQIMYWYYYFLIYGGELLKNEKLTICILIYNLSFLYSYSHPNPLEGP